MEVDGKMKSKYLCAFLVGIVCVFWLFPKLSFATTLTSGGTSGTEGLASFEGTWEFNSTGDNSGELVISLTNTTDVDSDGFDNPEDGFLTGIVFNNPEDLITGVSLVEDSSTVWYVIGDPDFDNDVNGQPFGHFDIGATFADSWEGGGSTSSGIAAGDTVVFTFTLSGAGVGGLTINDFINEWTIDHEFMFFAARFQSIGEGSDKVPAVPEPGTVLLLGSGLVGLALYGRKRFGKKKAN